MGAALAGDTAVPRSFKVIFAQEPNSQVQLAQVADNQAVSGVAILTFAHAFSQQSGAGKNIALTTQKTVFIKNAVIVSLLLND
jgi:hypothetical protein